MEHLASLEERDKAGLFLNRVHWPLLTTYSLPFNLENKEIFGFYKIITRQPKYVSLIEIFHKAFDNELSIGHDILTCTVNNYTDTKNITADFLLLWASGNTLLLPASVPCSVVPLTWVS